MTKKGTGKVTYDKKELELKLLTAIEEAIASAEARNSALINPTYEIYLVKDANKMLPIFPKDPDGSGYMLPLDVHPSIPAFVYYGERPDDFPKMIVVLDNMADEPAYMRNHKGAMCHEVGHLLSWNNKIKQELKEGLEGVLKRDNSAMANDIVDIVSEIRAEAIAVDSGYEREMLNIRKSDMKKALRDKVIYEHELENIMTFYASFRLIQNKTKDWDLRKEAVKLINETDDKLDKRLKSGKEYHKLLKEFTIWAVDSEAFKDIKAILGYNGFSG